MIKIRGNPRERERKQMRVRKKETVRDDVTRLGDF